MYITLSDNRYHEVTIDADTNCPYCKTPHNPKPLHYENFTHPMIQNRNLLIVTLQCTHCLFPRSLMMEYDGIRYVPISVPFAKPLRNDSVSNMSDISPIGYETYEQALSAEELGYNQLVGIGLRKALEFCIKDFLIATKPDESERVKKMPLKQLIDTYIPDPVLQRLSTGSVFLGNDETHYLRKFDDKDIQVLKKYIELTFQKIRQEMTAFEIEQEFLQS